MLNMHRRRLNARAIEDVSDLTPTGRRGVVGWLVVDDPKSPKTEPFDRKKCAPAPNLRPDTFTHHAGDFRGVVWEQHAAERGPSECLWLLCIDEHDDAYAKGCRRAFDGDLYPKDPAEAAARLEDKDEHEFAEGFARVAADLFARGVEAEADVEKGGYFATVEFFPSPPGEMWLITFRRMKATDKPREPRWLADSVIREIVETLFEVADMGEPSVDFSTLEFPIYDGRPRTAGEWLKVVAEETIGV